MQKTILKYCIAAFLLLSFSACDWLRNNDDTEYSNAPYFKSLKFASSDGIYVSFTLQYDSSTGDSIIVNLDSLPYQSNISKLKPSFTWASSTKACIYYIDSLLLTKDIVDTVYLDDDGKDTINFFRAVSITNTAADGKTTRTYPIKVNIHKVIPELYVWQRIKERVITSAADVQYQKAIFFKNKIFYYALAGSKYLYTSADGIEWTSEPATGLALLDTGFPERILEFKNKLYAMSDKLYVSDDGYNWTEQAITGIGGFDLHNLLFVFKDALWAIARNETDGVYHFASSPDGNTWNEKGVIPADFPVSRFASLSFASATNVPKALITGGQSGDNRILKNVWSTYNCTDWIDFSNTPINRIKPHTDASLIKYSDKVFLFGGKGVTDTDTPILESLNDGLSWSVPDSSTNALWQITPTTVGDSVVHDTLNYVPHHAPSVFYINPEGTKDHYIYLIGSGYMSDVWRGKQNKMGF